MKKLLGHDLGTYSFNAIAKTITFSKVSITQDQILLVTNTTDGIILYSFADQFKGGTLVGNVLTLNYDTSGMSNSDSIQIYIDVPDPVVLVSSQTDTGAIQIELLNQILTELQIGTWYLNILGQQLINPISSGPPWDDPAVLRKDPTQLQ